ncbi:flavin reductase family protein [Microbaculum sp. FT89]|uniref:flavin reductase family protein n=1 Tax=Microbaculum sp. FT89 TaxID=3447298 RepID=UPI003F52EAF2
MRRWASGVSLITSQHQGSPVGMAATAIMSLSVSPPSIAVCVNRTASLHPAIVSSQRFCVNFLNGRHEPLIPVFSGKVKGEARFAVGDWVMEDGPPKLADAQATLQCVDDGRVDYGTHTIFIGRVETAEFTDIAEPLIWLDGRVVRPE